MLSYDNRWYKCNNTRSIVGDWKGNEKKHKGRDKGKDKHETSGGGGKLKRENGGKKKTGKEESLRVACVLSQYIYS